MSIGLDIIAAHMLGDYILQNDWMAANKFKSAWVRTVHVFCYCLPFVAVAWLHAESWQNGLWFVLAVFGTHWLTDCRRWASGEKWCAKPIMVDQTIHIVTLAILCHLFLSEVRG